jgi:putative hydrolase of the HAD superfamily
VRRRPDGPPSLRSGGLATGVVLWDFDGTLAERPGGWRGMLVGILDELQPGHGFGPDRIAAGLTSGFPWHDPERAHPELRDPAAWWGLVVDVMRRGMVRVGVPEPLARAAARRVPVEYPRLNRWRLYPDTLAALEAVREAGWRSAILSNHCPELRAIVAGLGLDGLAGGGPRPVGGGGLDPDGGRGLDPDGGRGLDPDGGRGLVGPIFNSAEIDYEKPNPEAFRIALAGLGSPAPSDVVMVGDSLRADVEGAAAFGIRGILIRRGAPPDAPAITWTATLIEAARLIVSDEPT